MGLYVDDRLVLENSSLRQKVSELFDELGKSKELANVFIHDPVLVITSKILPPGYLTMSKKSINEANQLLYSALNNSKFTAWLESYQKKIITDYNKTKKLPNKQKMRIDLAKAIITNGDEKIIYNLLKDNESELWPLGGINRPVDEGNVAVCLITAILIAVLVVVVAIPGMGTVINEEDQILVAVTNREFRAIADQLVAYAKGEAVE